MKHYFSRRVRIVLLIAVLLAVALTVIGSLANLSFPGTVVQGILSPIRTGVSKLTDQAQQLYNYMFEFEAISQENAALKEKLAALEDDARKAEAIARENENLRALLELKTIREDYKLVDGYIISRSSTDWASTFTINTGANVGIEPGMCAITANNEVVGLVSEVGPNYAVIKSVMDSSLEISASLSSSGENGIVRGTYTPSLNGLLRMDYLPSSAVIRINDQVVTTGSTVYPRNLILGYVADAAVNDTGVAMYALLRPAVDVGSLEQVFIVTEYDVG